MTDPKELEQLYVPYKDQVLSYSRLSKNVYYMGFFTGFGELWARRQLWSLKLNGYSAAQIAQMASIRSQAFQEKALDKTLGLLKNCIILSTTPTYFSQYQNACLLKSRGFELLNDSCYLHPYYKVPTTPQRAHPGIPDCQEHYEHIWWKVQGPERPTEIGCPTDMDVSLNNCGVDGLNGLGAINRHDKHNRKHFLAVAWLPRGVAFPDDWKRFYSAEDYKLGHNFEARLQNSQKCPHNFDLKILEGWEPDFGTVPFS